MTAYSKEQPPACYVYTSTDAGTTWSIMSRVSRAFECSVTRLAGYHQVYLNARHAPSPSPALAGSAVPRVQAASYHDGAQFERNASFGPTFDPDSGGVLGATASIVSGNSSVLFFAIASGPAPYPTQLRDQKVNNGRRNMVLHSSKDEGAHWSALPLSTGLAGYVAMTTLPASGKLALLWETATDDECIGACALSFAIVDPRCG